MKKYFMLILSLGLIIGIFNSLGYATTIELTKPAILIDTFVGGGAPLLPGDAKYLEVGYHMGYNRSYLQFDLSTIPAGNMITEATLTLDTNFYSGGAGKLIQVYHVNDDALIKNKMTWTEQPSADSLLGENTVSQLGDVTWSLSATDLWGPGDLADGKISLQVRAAVESSATTYIQFVSSNYTGTLDHFPKLTIEYQQAASPVPIPGAILLLGAGMMRLALRIRKLKA